MPICSTGAPPVPDGEGLLRAVTNSAWWLADQGRVSTATFEPPVFSVDQASRSSLADTAGRFRDVAVVVEFNCGVARGINLDAHDEIDSVDPTNLAHANVYCTDFEDVPKKKRKSRLRAFVQQNCEYHMVGT